MTCATCGRALCGHSDAEWQRGGLAVRLLRMLPGGSKLIPLGRAKFNDSPVTDEHLAQALGDWDADLHVGQCHQIPFSGLMGQKVAINSSASILRRAALPLAAGALIALGIHRLTARFAQPTPAGAGRWSIPLPQLGSSAARALAGPQASDTEGSWRSWSSHFRDTSRFRLAAFRPSVAQGAPTRTLGDESSEAAA